MSDPVTPDPVTPTVTPAVTPAAGLLVVIAAKLLEVIRLSRLIACRDGQTN